jgi:hypothetical protein
MLLLELASGAKAPKSLALCGTAETVPLTKLMFSGQTAAAHKN